MLIPRTRQSKCLLIIFALYAYFVELSFAESFGFDISLPKHTEPQISQIHDF
jgi:hypothetical protein